MKLFGSSNELTVSMALDAEIAETVFGTGQAFKELREASQSSLVYALPDISARLAKSAEDQRAILDALMSCLVEKFTGCPLTGALQISLSVRQVKPQ